MTTTIMTILSLLTLFWGRHSLVVAFGGGVLEVSSKCCVLPARRWKTTLPLRPRRLGPLYVSVGLGPEEEEEEEGGMVTTTTTSSSTEEAEEAVVEPNHELYRTSRMSKFDEKCDAWFASLLGTDQPETPSFLHSVSQEARRLLLTLPELKREIPKPFGQEGFTPYVRATLPGTPILPAYGCEQYGIPIVRRNAEAWRQFDVFGMVQVDYSQTPRAIGRDLELDETQTMQYRAKLQELGVWLNDEDCLARLVYVNGCYCPVLSYSSMEGIRNVDESQMALLEPNLVEKLQRLPDGFTDTLAVQVPVGDNLYWNSYQDLSGPDHNVGPPTSQFAINSQQGTACFCALNSVRAGSVALVDIRAFTNFDHKQEAKQANDDNKDKDKDDDLPNDDVKPVLIIDAMTADGGVAFHDDNNDNDKGVAYHPRVLCVAGEKSRVGLVQSSVNLDDDDDNGKRERPKFRNGYTQVFVEKEAVVRHSQINESGGFVTPSVEESGGGGGEMSQEVDEDEEAKQRILAQAQQEAGSAVEEEEEEEKDKEEKEEVISPSRSATTTTTMPADSSSSLLSPRQVEAARPAMQNTYFETVDAHVVGQEGRYEIVSLEMGGHGRSRVASSVSLLQPGAHAKVRGLGLSGGLQVSDMRTNLLHVAQGTSSNQQQKNLVGGRSRAIFRGRVRVEQSAQQTESEQLSRTILLSDKAHIWTIPSLEIIADDVTCAHGATVADLSEEEMFYLQARGIDRELARNMLMFGFVSDASQQVHEAFLNNCGGGQVSLKGRVIERLKGIVPTGDRAVMGAFQSV